jgi:cyclase
MVDIAYTKGLHLLAPDTHAYLRPPGTWGYSNCGLIVAPDGEALLVDTQFDLVMTRELGATIAAVRPEVRVSTLVTTHANGDHCWGNQLFPEAVTVGSAATAHGVADEVQPAQLTALAGAPEPLGGYIREHFGAFDFAGITVTPPVRTFEGRLDLRVGERTVELIEVGPAHTDGDVIVYVPDAGVLFAGDILFVGDHPIMWTGPVDNWLAACDLIIDTGATRIVPGHGPVTDAAGVRLFRDYLALVGERASRAYAAGLPYWEAARFELPDAYAGWGRPERLVITMAAAYRHLGTPQADLLEVLTRAAAF